jgi:hypothetical protein
MSVLNLSAAKLADSLPGTLGTQVLSGKVAAGLIALKSSASPAGT